ncbi:MAG: hypothetical protein WC208_16725 [Gallionella sp.]
MINPTVLERQFVPSGSYSLRRANYINKIKQESLLSSEQKYALKTLFLPENQ